MSEDLRVAGDPVRWSEKLMEMISRLTPRQRRAIPIMVVALDRDDRSLRSLLHGPGKICNERTYYRRRKGWAHQPRFKAAVEQARREFQAALMSRAVGEAADMLRQAAPLSVQLAKQVVEGVLRGERDGEEQPPAVVKLLGLMDAPGIDAKDKIRAAQVLLNKGLQAALGILDRADIKTAVKQPTTAAEDKWARLLEGRRADGVPRRGEGARENVADR